MGSSDRFAALTAALLIGSASMAWPGSARAQAPTKNIYSFPSGTGDFVNRSSDLAADGVGNLYGVNLYGGVRTGGCAGDLGCGTIYQLVPPAAKGDPWAEQTLYTLVGAVSGYGSSGKPLLDAAGNIYGASSAGGTAGGQPANGTVWELSPPAVPGNPWSLNVLYTFANPSNLNDGGLNGADPFAGLVMDRAGTLYGTTFFGGAHGQGVIYSLVPPPAGGAAWTQTVLHSFDLKDDVRNPLTPLVLSPDQQTLSGVAGAGVFRLRRQGSAWTYSVLYRFTGGADGSGPVGSLVVDRNKNLFGATSAGGALGDGTVFEVSPPAPGQTAWTEQVLHSFTGADGDEPLAGLVPGGMPAALFGTTSSGGQGGAVDGSNGNQGVAFRLDPPASGSGPWTYTELHAFATGRNGSTLRGGAGDIVNGLTFGRNRLLFGVADSGGLHKQGAIFVQAPY